MPRNRIGGFYTAKYVQCFVKTGPAKASSDQRIACYGLLLVLVAKPTVVTHAITYFFCLCHKNSALIVLLLALVSVTMYLMKVYHY